MNKSKKEEPKSSAEPLIISHAGPMLKEQTLQQEQVKEPLLTAPELPIDILDKKKPAAKEEKEAKPEPEAKPAAETIAKAEPKPAEAVEQEDTSQIIPVNRLSIKPM